MREAFHYFIAADTVKMAPFKWGMLVLFAGYLLMSLYFIRQRGLRDPDILSLLLNLVILLRAAYPLFLNDETLDQTLRLLFFLFPLSTALLTHFLFTQYRKQRIEQLGIGLADLALLIANLALGGALVPYSPHWWADTYPLRYLNQTWLLASVAYSAVVVWRLRADRHGYAIFIRVLNLSLIVYLAGHFLLTLHTSMENYWIYRYHSFAADLLLIYAYARLLWWLYRHEEEPAQRPAFDRQGIDIYEVMKKVPSDRLIHHLEVNHPGSIPARVLQLTPREQLQAILMLHRVSIKECAEYSYITPQAVKVYRSRIRKKLA